MIGIPNEQSLPQTIRFICISEIFFLDFRKAIQCMWTVLHVLPEGFGGSTCKMIHYFIIEINYFYGKCMNFYHKCNRQSVLLASAQFKSCFVTKSALKKHRLSVLFRFGDCW